MFPVVTEQGSVLRASGLLTQPIPLGSALSWPVVDAPAGDGIASAANAASTAGKGQARRRDGWAGTVVIAGMNRHAPTDPSVARCYSRSRAQGKTQGSTYDVGPRRRGGVATQRPAKPRTPVRFRSAPLDEHPAAQAPRASPSAVDT